MRYERKAVQTRGRGEAWGNRKLSVICTISRLTIRRAAPDQCQECGKNNPESEARAHLRCGCSCDADLIVIAMTRVAIKKGDCSHYDKKGGGHRCKKGGERQGVQPVLGEAAQAKQAHSPRLSPTQLMSLLMMRSPIWQAGITGDRLGKFLEIPASDADHANGALITLHSISCNELQ